MGTNGISLTNRNITPVRGQAAFLPNQPLIHNCVVDPTATEPLVAGDIVTFTTNATVKGVTFVKKAAVTDKPCGVVVYTPIKSAFGANDKITIYPANSFYYARAAAANITIGSSAQFDTNGDIVATTTAGNGVVGVVWTEPEQAGDLIVIQVQPDKTAAA